MKIHEYHVTSLCAPPTIYRFLIKEDLSKYDLSSLEYCTTAGEALNYPVYNTFRELTGIKLMEGFGQTETTLTLANFPWMEPKPGSMGSQIHSTTSTYSHPTVVRLRMVNVDKSLFVPTRVNLWDCSKNTTATKSVHMKHGTMVSTIPVMWLGAMRTVITGSLAVPMMSSRVQDTASVRSRW